MIRSTMMRCLVAVALGFALSVAPGSATAAVTWGVKHIKVNTTLTDDHYGQVVISASGVTLDCAGHTIRMVDAYAKYNPCWIPPELGLGTVPCAIRAEARHNFTIANCNVGGGPYYGIWIKDANEPAIFSTYVYDAAVGIHIRGGAFPDLSSNRTELTDYGFEMHGVDSPFLSANDADNANIGFLDHFTQNAFYLSNNASGANVGFQNSWSTDSTYQGNVASGNVSYGLYMQGSNRFFLQDNFAFLTYAGYGISIESSSNDGFVIANQSRQNGGYDAFQDASSQNIWWGNLFTTIGGTVPATH